MTLRRFVISKVINPRYDDDEPEDANHNDHAPHPPDTAQANALVLHLC